MSNTFKIVAALSLVVVVAACSKEEEVVYVEPVQEEPTMSKY